MGAVIYWHMQLIHGQTKQQNKLTSFRVYLVVSTLNLQHSLKLLVIFKVAFWDDWPSFIWRRAVFCSTLSIWHHLASIIMQPGFTVPPFYFGGTPLSDMPLPQSVFAITVMFKTKARNFPHGIGPKSHAVLCIHTITKFYQRYWLKHKPWQYVHCAVQMTAHTELQLPLITVIIWYSID